MATTSISLIGKAQSESDPDAWRRLTDIYSPLISAWLKRQNVTGADAEDLAQEVLLIVLRKLPSFEHNGRPGAFRRWLRIIAVNRARDYWKANRIRPVAKGNTSFMETLSQLEDETSDLSRMWNEEHDLAVTRQLLMQIRPTVEPATWEAFELVTAQQLPATLVAEQLGLSVGAVYSAKSRVLTKLREAAEGMLDMD